MYKRAVGAGEDLRLINQTEREDEMSENVENYAGQEGSAGDHENVTEQCCEAAKPVGKYMGYEEEGHKLRSEIKAVGAKVKRYIKTSKNFTPRGDDSDRQNHGEMIANATLSYRHLEDAAMRIGKSIQAYNGGTSILDKMSVDEKKSVNQRPIAAEDH